jgi:hypothetical protein
MKNLADFALLCAVAAVTGYGFEWLHLPHGLLLGALLGSVLVGWGWRTRRRPTTPPWVLPLIQVVLGVSTGLLFQSGAGEFSASHLISFAFMWASLLVYMGVAFVWLRRMAGWSRTDALLAVYPGALAAVLDVFHVTRASNHVVLVHLLRLFVLTLLVTVLIPAAPMIAGQAAGLPVMQNGLSIGLLLLIIVGVGLLLRRWHVPAPYLLTAMVLTAWATHAGYVPPFAVPRGIADAITVLLGVLIGSILADLRWVDVLRHGRTGAMVLLIAIVVTALFAAVAAWVLDWDFRTLLVSYIPGAIETVATVTLAAGMNVMLILSHHLLRLLVLHIAPVLVRDKDI